MQFYKLTIYVKWELGEETERKHFDIDFIIPSCIGFDD